MSPEYVQPYVKAQKNDDRDAEAIAEAIAEAVTRPTMRFVELKSEAQLDKQSLHRARAAATALVVRTDGFLRNVLRLVITKASKSVRSIWSIGRASIGISNSGIGQQHHGRQLGLLLRLRLFPSPRGRIPDTRLGVGRSEGTQYGAEELPKLAEQFVERWRWRGRRGGCGEETWGSRGLGFAVAQRRRAGA